MKNQVGIWLDSRKAIIIKANGNEDSEVNITAELDSKHVKGGARSSTPYGPQDVVSDSRIMERRKHQAKQYYQKILKEVKGTEEVLILGPGDTKIKLQQVMLGDNNFEGTLVVTETSDKITDNQIRARIREFFK